MTFRQLEVFLAVVRLGTVSTAAKFLGITQSGASRMIAELENNVGFPLFHRSGRGLEITQQGRTFHEQVEKYFDGMDALKHAVRQIRSGVMDRIRLACLPTLSTSILPGAIKTLRDDFPDISIEIETVLFEDAIEMMKTRRVDVMISFLMDEMDGVTVSKLAETNCVLAAQNTHPLAKLNTVRAVDLKDHEVMGQIPAQIDVPGQDNASMMREGIIEDKPKHLWCHTSSTRYALVAAGLAVSIAEPFASPLFRAQGVVVRDFEPALPLNYGFAAYSDVWDSPEIRSLHEALRTECRKFSKSEGISVKTD